MRWYNLDSMSLEEETMEEEVEKRKRAPRKRVNPDSFDTAADETPAVRKRVPRKTTSKAAMPVEITPLVTPAKRVARNTIEKTAEPIRKAPTPIAAERAATKTSRRQAIVVGVLMIIGVGASAAIGLTDKGSINVENTIAERNARISSGEIQGEILEVQNTPQLPDGGLMGLGIGGPETNASSSQPAAASSSEATASSTPPAGIPLTAAEAAALQNETQASTTGQ